MMLDDVPEEEEIEAMIASYEQQQSGSTQRPASPSLSDDEEYDDIFAELMSQEQPRQANLQNSLDQMDITDGNDDMPS